MANAAQARLGGNKILLIKILRHHFYFFDCVSFLSFAFALFLSAFACLFRLSASTTISIRQKFISINFSFLFVSVSFYGQNAHEKKRIVSVRRAPAKMIVRISRPFLFFCFSFFFFAISFWLRTSNILIYSFVCSSASFDD